MVRGRPAYRRVTDPDAVGAAMGKQMRTLYPILRSITGDGVRRTLEVVAKDLPELEERAVPSGTDAFDWTVNDEWNVREASIADADGTRVVDVADHTLHLVSYSTPFRGRLSLDELRPHLHTLPEQPDLIPYRTSYYHRDWGFCLSQRTLDALGPGPYDVVVDTTLEPGELSYGELVLPGRTDEEVLISAHVCHPSLANDNLTGIAVATQLALSLASLRRRFTYRFVFAPGTIGSITWLARNPDVVPRIRHGLVLTGLGGPGPLTYKQTRRGDRPIDDAARHVLGEWGGDIRAYSPYGYDERQYNALGFDLAVGRLSRTPHGEYPEYHTSADDLDFVSTDRMVEALAATLEMLAVVERDRVYRNLVPYGEPQLGKRGLYPTTGGKAASDAVMAMLWVLAYTDGEHRLLDIARLSGLGFDAVRSAATTLADAGLLAAVDDDGPAA